MSNVMARRPGFRRTMVWAAVGAVAVTGWSFRTPPRGAEADRGCPAVAPAPLVADDPALCEALESVVRDPAGLDLGAYQRKLGEYLGGFCHRRPEAGWAVDESLRDTGPFTSMLVDGHWQGSDHGTHAPVRIWYSPEMADWIRSNRGRDARGSATDSEPVPDGAVIVKEMYPAPARRCADVDPLRLLPTSGAAVMVRATQASHDGWFWGWFGWSGWDPDVPPSPDANNRLPYMGFGQYCVNCHASARDNLTFSSARNLEGEPGDPLVFLSMDDFAVPQAPSHHATVTLPADGVRRLGQPRVTFDPAVLAAFPMPGADAATWGSVSRMPSETWDNVWMPAGAVSAHGQYLTSDQCLGCHDAGSTGLHFDMTRVAEDGRLIDDSPYASWRTSPMGLAGRDPIFFAQLASETQSFHPGQSAMVQDTCLGCHGILGQRQHGIDRHRATGECGTFTRDGVNAVPGAAASATVGATADGAATSWGALARDGISCMACHHMVLGEEAAEAHADAPQNVCVSERQEALNPDAEGFARTFTGSFLVGPPDELYGPFEDPRTAPMEAALGVAPVHDQAIASSEMCGTCHTVHLPVLHGDETVAHVYEQTTYPEWAFSAYRTGRSPDGDLPVGAGDRAQECQACHMPSTDENGEPLVSKIASIQEHAGFPEADFTRPAEAIDLEEREGFARHTLVGLNVFLVKMAQQFPDILGIRTRDPMLGAKGIDPLVTTEQAMLDLAATATADVAIGQISHEGDRLLVPVTVTNHVGHKFPSGVGFRRAFLTFEVLDARGRVLWASGRTDPAGRLVDRDGAPIAGEVWWEDDCSARLDPLARAHQPHHQTVSREDTAQIYQELVSTPPREGDVACGHEAEPRGRLTTSFLSICAEVKDNRLLPSGYLPVEQRRRIARALGAGDDLAEDAGSTAVGDDPDYVSGGSDTLVYAVAVDELGGGGAPASVRARLYYQATPPFYLQDRFCSATGPDRDRLYFLTGHLDLDGTQAEGWKLLVADSGAVAVPGG